MSAVRKIYSGMCPQSPHVLNQTGHMTQHKQQITKRKKAKKQSKKRNNHLDDIALSLWLRAAADANVKC